jgi:hypothetical protein
LANNFDQKRRTKSGSYDLKELRGRSHINLPDRSVQRGSFEDKKRIDFFSKMIRIRGETAGSFRLLLPDQAFLPVQVPFLTADRRDENETSI